MFRALFPRLIVLVLSLCSAQIAAARPNVLFLFADDQRPDAIAALGNPALQTPNLDRLARRGFVFQNTYCMGSTVGAVCNPSRHMTLSGRALFHYDPDEPRGTFADVMRRTGYETWQLSKRGNTARAYHTAFEHSAYLNDFRERESGHHGKTGADRAIHFLREQWNRDRPFCLYLGFTGPHDPRVAAPQWLDLYERDKIPLPANFLPWHPFNNGELVVRDERLAPWPRTEDVVRRHLHDYYACISSIDHHVGRVLAALDEIGESDNTIIVYSADHGLAIGSHGLFGKQSLYEHSMKSPLIFAGPGIKPGKSDALAYLYDIFPTLVDLVDGDLPSGLDGKSLAPVLREQRGSVRDAVFLAYKQEQRAVRVGDWKLIRYPQVDVTQLFDLETDPHEVQNLAGRSEYADRVTSLLARLAALQVEFHDTAPLSVARPTDAAVDEAFFAKEVARVDAQRPNRRRGVRLPGAAKRVVFLGDSITHAGHYISLIETALRSELRQDLPELINLGLPSETCSGLSEPQHPFPRPNVHERLDRALNEIEPDLVVAGYGMNDGIYYPFGEDRFRAFRDGIDRLIARVNASGAELVLLTPPPFDALPLRDTGGLAPDGAAEYSWTSIYERYDEEVLARYAQWLLAQRDRVAAVIDLRRPVLRYVRLRRKTRPDFSLSSDGVHLNEEGHAVLATAILRTWGHGEMWQPEKKLQQLVEARSALLHAAWVSHVGHTRPGMPAGLPLHQAKSQAATIDQQIRAALELEP